MLVPGFFSVFGTQEQIRNGLPVKITVTHWDGEKMYEIALLPTRSLWHGSIAGKIWRLPDVFISNDGKITHSWSESSTLRRGCPVLNRIWDSRQYRLFELLTFGYISLYSLVIGCN